MVPAIDGILKKGKKKDKRIAKKKGNEHTKIAPKVISCE